MTATREPFFHRATTHRAISGIASCKDPTVYVGARYSIDRSGLLWDKMISSLLEFNGSSPALNDYPIKQYGNPPAASIAENEYRAVVDPGNSDEDTHRKISDRLRAVLYSPLAWQRGELGMALADFAYTWINYGMAASSRRIAFITPNYDDYLHIDLTAGWDRAKKVAQSRDENAAISSWARVDATDSALLDNNGIRCAYLHGRIPVAAKAEERFPVVSENDYALTRPVLPPVRPPATAVRDLAELLHVHVDQLARPFAFVAHGGLFRGPDHITGHWIALTQVRNVVASQDPQHRPRRHPDLGREEVGTVAVLGADSQDLLLDLVGTEAGLITLRTAE